METISGKVSPMDDRRTKRGLRSRTAERSEDEKSTRPGLGPASGGGGIFKSAAVAVLRQHRKLMTTGDITRLAVEMGLLKCQGKTPEATMASALYTDVKRKLQKSLFTRPQEGLFGLREWLEEGYYPEGWVGPPDGLGLAPFKRRNTTGPQQTGTVAPVSTSRVVRQGVRTGPGRSSKSRASRSWRTASSDAEDDDMLDEDEDEALMTGKSYIGGSSSAAVHGGVASMGGALGGHGEDEDMDDAMGEGEDGDMDDDVDGGDDTLAEDGLDEPGSDRREDEQGGGAGTSEEQQYHATSTRGYTSQLAASPGPGTGRRRFRSGGGGVDPGLTPDECLSPLHMLGEAAASESLGDMAAEPHDTPPAKRRRPSSITVPERGGGLGGITEGITPKSPYEDSLAALHEIATSPSTFELTSHREAQHRDREAARSSQHGSDGAAVGTGGSGKVGRARPRLHVDVPAHGTDLVSGSSSRRDVSTPGTALLTDNPMHQVLCWADARYDSSTVPASYGETTPAILLQASPVTTADGQQAMMLRRSPVLVTLPPALASPGSAAASPLDTPALLHVQLPGGTPSELMQTTLITSTGQQLTPLRSHASCAAQVGRGGLKVDTGPASSRGPGRRVSFSGQVGILGPPANQQLQPPTSTCGGMGQSPTPGGASWPPRLTPAQVEHQLTQNTRVQTVIERLESKLGRTHPQVGKAWLSLARMYQHLSEAQRNNGEDCSSSRDKSVEALKRALAVCRAVAECCGSTLHCEAAFDYLVARNSNSVGELETAGEAGTSPGDSACPAASTSQCAGEEGVDGRGAASASPISTPVVAPVPNVAQNDCGDERLQGHMHEDERCGTGPGILKGDTGLAPTGRSVTVEG